MQVHDLDLSPVMRGVAGNTEGIISIVALVMGPQEAWCGAWGTGVRGAVRQSDQREELAGRGRREREQVS